MRETGKIIAVDFDGTLCENAFPAIGSEKPTVIEGLKRARQKGARLILWTCRDGKQLTDAIDWCLERGICFDAVNEGLPEMLEAFGNDTRKVFADVYLDDRAMRPEECLFLM